MESILEKIKINAQKTLYLLFICTGNICRSPMAEMLCEQLIEQNPLSYFNQITIKSAAAIYRNGGIDYEAGVILNKCYKIPNSRINQFQSTHIHEDPSRCKEADFIITMEFQHKDHIPRTFQTKTFLLPELATGTRVEVDDPYGGSLATYKRTGEEIYHYLQLFLITLRNEFG